MKNSRLRAKIRIRKKISGTTERPRLTVFRSSKHTFAQLICDDTGEVLVTASTQEKGLEIAGSKKSVDAAKSIGKVIAMRAKEKKISKAVFDRNGYIYTGRVSAVADGAREGGLNL